MPVSEPSSLARVSVLIPAYNHATYVRETLASIAGQDYADVEVIVVDDGSSDDTLGVCRAAFQEFGLQGEVLHQPNKGTISALQVCLRRATGSYIILFSSDDMLLPGRISRQVAELEADPTIDVLCGTCVKLFPDGRRKEVPLPHVMRAQRRGRLPELIYLRDDRGPLLQSGLFRRAVFDRLGGYERAVAPEDWWLVTGAMKLGLRLVVRDRPEVVYRLHATNTHARPDRLRRGRLQVISSHCPSRLQRRARANLYASLARAHVQQPWRALAYLTKSQATRPSVRNLFEFGYAVSAEARQRVLRGTRRAG